MPLNLCIDSKKREKERGPEFTLNGVKLNAKQITDTDKYFEPLIYCIANSKKIEFKTKLKQTYWDCEWTEDDDKSLLQGILEHGYGNWELIKADPQFNLGQKILISSPTPNDRDQKSSSDRKTLDKSIKLKPQSKHLRTRIDYLMKVLQNQINQEKYGPNWKEASAGLRQNKVARKKDDAASSSNPAPGSSSHTGDKSSGANGSPHTSSKSAAAAAARKKAEPKSSSAQHSLPKIRGEKKKRKHDLSENGAHDSNNESDNSESNSDSKKKRANASHDHHHDEDTHSDAEANRAKKEKKTVLNEKIFNECKNILRPVKKALKNLDVKEDKDHVEKMRLYLLEIGDTINEYLSSFSDPEKIKEWRNFLWTFVAKFTTWDSERLKNVYRKFANTRDEHEMNRSAQLGSTSRSVHGSYSGKASSSAYGAHYQGYGGKYSGYEHKKSFDYGSSRDGKSKYSGSKQQQQLDNRSSSYREYDKNFNYLPKSSGHFSDADHHYANFTNHSSSSSSYPDHNEMQYQNFHSGDFRAKPVHFSGGEQHNQ
jgi:hypothetical protein